MLICVDALRGDRLGYQGYAHDTSPAIDALARRGVQFRHCFSTYPQTSPSVASLFTSLHPSAHKKSEDPGTTLTSSVALLAQTFLRSGYRTAAVATNPHLSPGFGYEQGFEHFCYVSGQSKYSFPKNAGTYAGTETEVRPSDAPHYGRGDAASQAALDWLARLPAGSEPFFLYLHYMDVHNPYAAPDPYRSMFVQEEGLDRYCNGVPKRPVSAHDLGYMQGLYDGGIRYLDGLVGELLASLEQRGLLQDTYVLFVADHGDEFLEHGGLGHGGTLFRELLHVPLFLVGPGVPARVVESTVSTIDVYPTLCELAGIAIPAHVQGASLVPLFTDAAGERRPRPVFAECANTRMRSAAPAREKRAGARVLGGRAARKDGAGYSVLDEEWHLIRRPESGQSELYRYRDDPAEAVDLCATYPDEVARLSAHAEQMLQESRARGRAIETGEVGVGEATRAELEALGYGGGDGGDGGDEDGE